MIGALREPDVRERLGNARRTFLLRQAERLERHVDVLVRVERWDEIEPLKHEADLMRTDAAELAVVRGGAFAITEADRVGARPVQRPELLQQRGLSPPVGPWMVTKSPVSIVRSYAAVYDSERARVATYLDWVHD